MAEQRISVPSVGDEESSVPSPQACDAGEGERGGQGCRDKADDCVGKLSQCAAEGCGADSKLVSVSFLLQGDVLRLRSGVRLYGTDGRMNEYAASAKELARSGKLPGE